MDTMLQKVIAWLLSALILIMTSIGGSTAARLITQLDEVAKMVNNFQVSLAVSETNRVNMEVQIHQIQETLQKIESEQDRLRRK